MPNHDQNAWNINISIVDLFILSSRTYLCPFGTFIAHLRLFAYFSNIGINVDAQLRPIWLEYKHFECGYIHYVQ